MPTSRVAGEAPTSAQTTASLPVDHAERDDPSTSMPPLLRIQEVASETGATPRAVRYYEEIGLLKPAARSEGDYRLYDASDVERIRHIRELRDVAGFSLAEISQLLEDEEARANNRAVYRATEDSAVRREVLIDSLDRIDRSTAVLQSKIERLARMVREAEARRERLIAKLNGLSTDAENTR
jgi:DNA-binding transcriptional MerR regulator